MALINRSSFRKQLQEGLNAIFGLEYKRYPQEWREIFDVYKSSKAYEEDVLMTGLGAAQVKAEGAGVAYDTGAEAWVARYMHETIALAFAITEEAVEDNLYGDIGARYARALARSMQHTKEVKGANVLNNGFSSSYPGGDGKALFATDHPLQGGGTLSNTFAVAADLAEASLEDAMIQIAGWTDDRGIPIAAQALKLIIPPALHFVAERLLATNQRPGTGDNDVNALKSTGMLPQGYTVNHRLTDTDAWFLKTDVPDGLKFFQRKALQRGMEGDFETGNSRYKARERYTMGWTDPRAAFGTAGA
jgi:phage major head subunit gpT-like protein